MRSTRLAGSLPGLSLVTALVSVLALPGTASAQIFVPAPFVPPPRVRFRVWVPRPRVMWYPPAPRVVVGAPAANPYCCVQPPPVVPPPPVLAQPCPPAPCCQQGLPPPPMQPYYAPPLPPPPVMVQPAPLPPPVMMAPPPVMMAPPPVAIYRAPVTPYVAPVAPVVRPQWTARVGLGGRFAGLINTDSITQSSQLGFGGELLFRVARHLSLEVAGEYQRTIDDGFARYDVPLTFGLRIHIGPPEWLISPYFVVASGMNYANLDFLHAHDTAWFLDGQAGGGLELRLGRHFALTGDVRADGRHRLTAPADVVAATTSVNGKPFQPMQDQAGGQFRLGAAVYF